MEFEIDEGAFNNREVAKTWQERLYDLNRKHPILPLRVFGIKRDLYALLLSLYVLTLMAIGSYIVTAHFANLIAFFTVMFFVPFLLAHFSHACTFMFYRIAYFVTSHTFILVCGLYRKLCSFFVLLFRSLKFNSAATTNSKTFENPLDVPQESSDDEDEQPREGAETAPMNLRRRFTFYSSDESD